MKVDITKNFNNEIYVNDSKIFFAYAINNKMMSYEMFFDRLKDLLYNNADFIISSISFDGKVLSVRGITNLGLDIYYSFKEEFSFADDLLNDQEFLIKLRSFLTYYRNNADLARERAKEVIKNQEIHRQITEEAGHIYTTYCDTGEMPEITSKTVTMPEYANGNGIYDECYFDLAFEPVEMDEREVTQKVLTEYMSVSSGIYNKTQYDFQDDEIPESYPVSRYDFKKQTKNLVRTRNFVYALAAVDVANLVHAVVGSNVSSLAVVPNLLVAGAGVGLACFATGMIKKEKDSLRLVNMWSIANRLDMKLMELNGDNKKRL